ncbi:MAG: PD-(D/E)XK nuclease family protein [Betaproteobacteria bacterium]|nr:PD-(D/E)XK nuclease family protein [Betaproteobacteria bacterium]
MNSSSIEHRNFAPSTLIEDAASWIVARHTDLLPDLSSLTVVLPLRAAPALKAALAAESRRRGHAAILLPKVGALPQLAAAWPAAHAGTAATESERTLQVFQALKSRRWFTPAESLRVARELTRLINALTAEMATLPKDAAAHQRDLARAYAHQRQNSDFSFEATLTYDIWRASAQAADGSVDAETRYALQLAAWVEDAKQASSPLIVFGARDWTRRERHFLERYAGHAPVVMLDADSAVDTPRGAYLARAFRHAPGAEALPDDNGAIDTAWLQARVTRDVEEEANAALATLRQWLREDLRNIAVVALDRQTARRLRALAEREQILMQDEIGWPYSTTVCATALMRWLEARQDGFYHATLFDLLKSPFLFADLHKDWGRERVRAAVGCLERAARRAGVVAGLLRMREAVTRLDGSEHPVDDACALLDRLIAADRAFAPNRRPPSQWLADLRVSLHTLGIEAGWAGDAAGLGLIECLNQLAEEVARIAQPLAAGEWQDWLRMALEEAHFRDTGIDSPVVVTSLAATRFRRFDGVIVIGASARHLPGAPQSDGLFNQSVRRALGLRTHRDESVSITHDLAGLLHGCRQAWMSWQSDATDEPSPPAPWLHALMLEARRSGADILQASTPASTLPSNASRARSAPMPSLLAEQVPARISASGYQSLIDCPYQYFARAVLRLRETDEIAEAMDKRDFGELVHAILHRFHRRFARVSDVDEAILNAAFREESEAVFAQALQQNFLARAWLQQWQDVLPSYLAWQRSREAAGWQWRAGEVSDTLELAGAAGAALVLEGRIDRIDARADAPNAIAVIDYKARQATALRQKLRAAGEDVQLPVYAALMAAQGSDVQSAAYLAISADGVKPVELEDAADAGMQARERLVEMFDALRHGAALPAQGVDSVCRTCEARGLCRRDHWDDAHD